MPTVGFSGLVSSKRTCYCFWHTQSLTALKSLPIGALWLTPHRRQAQGFSGCVAYRRFWCQLSYQHPLPLRRVTLYLCPAELCCAESVCSSVVEVKFKMDELLLHLGLRVHLVASFEAKVS